MAREMDVIKFKGGRSWCLRFMKRHNLSVRAVTSVRQHMPANSNELIAQFWAFVKQNTIGVDPSNLENMDEIPVAFDLPKRYTVDV